MNFKNRLNKILRRFNVELHGLGYLQSLAKGEFKKDEFSFFKKNIEENEPIIYDAGANKGLMINNFFSLFPDASVHAFEPIKDLCKTMRENFPGKKNLVVNECGIGNKQTEMNLNINFNMDTSSFLTSKKTGLNSDKQVETQRQVTVPVITLDSYAKKNNHRKINLLKLDIQGSELNALNGAAFLLKNKMIDMIFTETYFIQQYEGQPLFHEIASFLFENGYELQDLYNPFYGKGKIAWCDSLFIRSDLKLK